VNAKLALQSPVAHEHHARLVRHVDRMPRTADLIEGDQPAQLRFALDETCGFLTDLLLPHMAAAERALYPELERLLQNRHSMSPMRREHEQIRSYVTELEAIRAMLGDGSLSPRQQTRLRRLLFQLYALLKVHLAEELLYADMVEHGASTEREAALATAMEHAGTSTF
jgi:hemerythrin-like domain-containing protein